MKSGHSKLVKEHFEVKYQDYDALIPKLIPRYQYLQSQTIRLLGLDKKTTATVLELGIGTGQSTEQLLKLYPYTHVTGVDISPGMLAQGQKRLKSLSKKVTFIEQDIAHLKLKSKFDGCFGVLTVHHLNSTKKLQLFKKIYKLLKPGSSFVLGDLIKFPTVKETQKHEQLWKRYLQSKLGKAKAQYWFENYLEEDIPSTIPEHLKWLRAAGFTRVRCTWQYLNYAVLVGTKP